MAYVGMGEGLGSTVAVWLGTGFSVGSALGDGDKVAVEISAGAAVSVAGSGEAVRPGEDIGTNAGVDGEQALSRIIMIQNKWNVGRLNIIVFCANP
jgi:hypothetical protein